MFTGLIEELGIVKSVRPRGTGLRLEIKAMSILADIKRGDSIAVNGVCLTAVDLSSDSFVAELLEETKRRTYFDRLRPGMMVNLERPLRASDRLGGHFVQGHVDGVGDITASRPVGEDRVVTVRYPMELDPYFVEKGSVALDGISLTIAKREHGRIHVALIPETLVRTTLGRKGPGDPLHIEVDVIGKYVERFIMAGHGRSK